MNLRRLITSAPVAGLLVAGVLLTGCAAVEQKVDQVAQEAETRVQQEIDKATAAARQEATKAAEQAKQDILAKVDPDGTVQGAAAKVQEAQTMLNKIEQGQVFDPEVQAWIQKTLAEKNAALQAAAIPVANAAYEKFPEKRAWLEGQVRQTMANAEGPLKQGLQDVLDAWTRLQDVAAAQR